MNNKYYFYLPDSEEYDCYFKNFNDFITFLESYTGNKKDILLTQLDNDVTELQSYNINTINEYVTNFSKKFLKNEFNIDLNIPIYIGETPEGTNGIFNFADKNKEFIIINKSLKDAEKHCLEKVLIHELLHYALYEQNKEFKDGTKTFEKYILLYNSVSNYSTEEVNKIINN